MRTSELVAAAVIALLPIALIVGPACVDPSACLRNSDCPAADICSVGACVSPSDNADGAVDGTLSEAASDSGAADATVSDSAADASDASADAKKDGTADARDTGASRDATGQ
jgi:hypothetical protein